MPQGVRVEDAVVKLRVEDIQAPCAGLQLGVGQCGLRLCGIAEGFADREHAGRCAAVALALGRAAGLRWMQSDAPARTAAADADRRGLARFVPCAIVAAVAGARKSVAVGQSASDRVDLGVSRSLKKKNQRKLKL